MYLSPEKLAAPDRTPGKAGRSGPPPLRLERAVTEPVQLREEDLSPQPLPVEEPDVRNGSDFETLVADGVLGRAVASDLRRSSAALRRQARELSEQARFLAAATQDIREESSRLKAEAKRLVDCRCTEPNADAGTAHVPGKNRAGGSNCGV